MKNQLTKHFSPEPFMYKDFQDALKCLKSALTQGHTYALLLGESGTGKTSLLRILQAKLDKRRFNVLYLSYGQPSPSGLVRLLAETLHLPIRRTRTETSRLLIQTLRNLPTRLLFWIDEAQLIQDDTLQEIRLLSEAELDGTPLFSVVFSALPSLKDRLLAPHLFPLWRRITPRVKLTGLLREEVGPFLIHVLSKESVGHFSQEAISAIFEQARGIPALVESFAIECLRARPTGDLTADKVSEVLDNLETD